MGEHAKLPWEAVSDGWQPWPGAIAIKADDGYIIAYTTSGSNEKENAELLCKAASSHGALVEERDNLRTALEFIRDGYANQDVNHVDYRVKVYQVALEALASVATTARTAEG